MPILRRRRDTLRRFRAISRVHPWEAQGAVGAAQPPPGRHAPPRGRPDASHGAQHGGKKGGETQKQLRPIERSPQFGHESHDHHENLYDKSDHFNSFHDNSLRHGLRELLEGYRKSVPPGTAAHQDPFQSELRRTHLAAPRGAGDDARQGQRGVHRVRLRGVVGRRQVGGIAGLAEVEASEGGLKRPCPPRSKISKGL